MANRTFMGQSPAIVDSALNDDEYSQFFNMPNSPEALDEDMLSTSEKFTPDNRYPGLIIPATGESSASPESFSQDSASDSSSRNHNRKTSSNSSFSNWRDGKRAGSSEEVEPAKKTESVRSEDVEMGLPTYESHFSYENSTQLPFSRERQSLASPFTFSAPAPRRQTSAEGWGQFPNSDSTGRVNPFLDSLEPYAQLQSPSMHSVDHSMTSPNGLLPNVLMRNSRPEEWSPSMFDAQSPFQTQSPMSTRSLPRQPAKCELRIADTPFKSRVETQIKIVLTLDPMPPGITKLHLPKHTISKPKLLTKDELSKAPDMLELHTMLVCTSAVADPDALERALARARTGNFDPELLPLDGGEVRICSGCIQRERKRAARKKMKKVEEEEHWAKDEAKRVIVFNCPEVKDWQPAEGSAMMIDAPMRIACYCRHQSEKVGFRVIFTIKDHLDNVVAQGITNSIMITDDHKTHAATSPVVPAVAEPRPSTKNQQRRSEDFANGSKMFFGNNAAESSAMSPVSPSANNTTASSTPKTLSRQPSFSGPSGPSAKKRKTPSGHKVPSDLAMTKLETPADSVASSRTSSKAPSAATSPFHRMPHSFPGFDNMAFPPLTGFTPLTPNSNDIGLGMQPMDVSKSASSSTRPSRASSPSTAFRSLMGKYNDTAVERPRIHRIIPGEGPTSGAIEVTCLGRGFHKGLEVMFGPNVATTTTFWGESTLVCLLPPAVHPGVVPVTFKDDRYSAAPQSYATFKYVDNNERDLLRLALTVLGQKMTGKAEDAHEVALRIMGSTSTMWQSSVNDGSGPSMSGEQMEKNLVVLLDTIDRDDSEHEAELDMDNNAGHTMLHLASALGFYSFVSGLLSRGADPNVVDGGGLTPLHFAALHGHAQVVRKLLQKGADPTIQNDSGHTPDELAESLEVLDLTRTRHHVRRRSGASNLSRSRNSSANSLVLSRNQSSTLLASMSRISLNHAAEDDEDSLDEDDPQLWMRPRRQSQHDEPSLWIKSRRGSMQQVSAEDLTNEVQGPAHNALAAFREQLAAQLHFLQQFRLPQYQNYLPNTMARFNSFVPGRGGSDIGDDKESHWWEMFSSVQSSAPPPAYDEIYPVGIDEELDRKTKKPSSVRSEASSSSSSSGSLNVEIGRHITNKQKAQLRQARAKNLKNFGNDRKLFFIWIPLLLLVMLSMLRTYVPIAWQFGTAVFDSAVSLTQGRLIQNGA